MVLESSSSDMNGGGYRATLWNLTRQQKIEMIATLELELAGAAVGIALISSRGPASYQKTISSNSLASTSIRFLTVEKTSIKIWEYSSGSAELLKKIQIKQVIKQCIVADLTEYLLILGDNGKVLILDQEGEFVSTICKDMVSFSVIGTASNDKILLGTDRGTICVYHMASLQFISEVPYQLSMLSNFQLNGTSILDKALKRHEISVGGNSRMNPLLTEEDEQDLAQSDQFSLFKVGPPVIFVQTTMNMRYLFIKYADHSFVMIDRTVLSPSQAIMGH